MLFIFFILSAVLSLIILFAKNNLLTKSLTPIYLISVVAISIYSYLHLNQTDTVYYQFDALGILLTMVLALLSLPTFTTVIYILNGIISQLSKKPFITHR